MHLGTLLTVLVLISFLCADYLRRRKFKVPKGKFYSSNQTPTIMLTLLTGLKLPPGPTGKPIVGSFFGLHKVLGQNLMYQWREKYMVNALFQQIIEIAQELFEKRGALYSDRPSFPMALLLAWDYSVPIMRYGDWWRRHIRAFQQFFNSRAVSSFEPIKLKARQEILKNLPDTPEKFPEHIRHATGRIIMDNRANPDYSFVSSSLERLKKLKDPLPNEEVVIRNVAGTAYGGGATTSFATLLQAVVASILYPEAQEKVYEELDTVIGDRLPTLADRKNLPYVNAFIYEVLRWRPVVPLGVPHTVLEDDVYGEYFIPRGSIIIADSWYDELNTIF
ncbi:hypothetical protein Clacol_007778 [Clathrus columnatus]|uniref:Cytochrome P450 n=1 Tax=Clathrus columnatus TaxID=1419009 RepID=A0AAV5ALE7_9AGAM|nr:hypothetical protein Clacol_007778 [Clathrus columnatus]